MSEISEMLEQYVQIADYIDGQEAQLKPAKEALANIKEALLGKMNELDLNSLKSIAGHAVSRVKTTSAKVEDAEAFYDFVFDTGDTSFLTKHVSKDAVEAYIAEKNETPPGVISEQVVTIRFTRAKKI